MRFLCVSSFNDGARRLYERLGYQYIRELRDHLMPGASELLYRKFLDWSPCETGRADATSREETRRE